MFSSVKVNIPILRVLTPCSRVHCSSIQWNLFFQLHSPLPRTYRYYIILFSTACSNYPTIRYHPIKHIITLQLVSFIPSFHDLFSRYDFDKQHIIFEVTVPRIDITGQYNVSGRILLLPITGNGDVNMTLGN